MNDILLNVNRLNVRIPTRHGLSHIVRDVDLQVNRGETLAIVGESGCGKSMTMQALLKLCSKHTNVQAQAIDFNSENLLLKSEREWNAIRGNRISMIFQDPMNTFNPTMTIGQQIAEPLIAHRGFSRKQAYQEAIQWLKRTQIPDPEKRAHQHPHHFSGGMLQRAAIAMALICKPDLLIADEPTTALDVTLQKQVLDLIKRLQQEENVSLILITHDLGVVANYADKVSVMYAGRIVEHATVEELFTHPAHPYTRGLLRAQPNHATHIRLEGIPGQPPPLTDRVTNCAFANRCAMAMQLCHTNSPPLFGNQQHHCYCWLQHPAARAHSGMKNVPVLKTTSPTDRHDTTDDA